MPRLLNRILLRLLLLGLGGLLRLLLLRLLRLGPLFRQLGLALRRKIPRLAAVVALRRRVLGVRHDAAAGVLSVAAVLLVLVFVVRVGELGLGRVQRRECAAVVADRLDVADVRRHEALHVEVLALPVQALGRRHPLDAPRQRFRRDLRRRHRVPVPRLDRLELARDVVVQRRARRDRRLLLDERRQQPLPELREPVRELDRDLVRPHGLHARLHVVEVVHVHAEQEMHLVVEDLLVHRQDVAHERSEHGLLDVVDVVEKLEEVVEPLEEEPQLGLREERAAPHEALQRDEHPHHLLAHAVVRDDPQVRRPFRPHELHLHKLHRALGIERPLPGAHLPAEPTATLAHRRQVRPAGPAGGRRPHLAAGPELGPHLAAGARLGDVGAALGRHLAAGARLGEVGADVAEGGGLAGGPRGLVVVVLAVGVLRDGLVLLAGEEVGERGDVAAEVLGVLGGHGRVWRGVSGGGGRRMDC
mmetsp:Transcript_20385/g.54317  ORF Transcript_20385/g.54317 Transcript_20385/m.54317 type:complete len:473 (+) Transcript_20385:126-1544(+)